MPLSNGKYVSPTWKNGQAPALDAAELQAITDTVAELVGNVDTLLGNTVNIATGSYTGTGETSGRTINLPFTPKFFAVMLAKGKTTNTAYYYKWAFCTGTNGTWGGSSTGALLYFSISTNTIRLNPLTDSASQGNSMNMSGEPYKYFAIG